MTRTHGWGPIGQRVPGIVPRNRGWRIAVRANAGIYRSTLDDERLYVEDGAQLQAFAVGTGTRLWGATMADREIVDSLWSDDGRLMVGYDYQVVDDGIKKRCSASLQDRSALSGAAKSDAAFLRSRRKVARK